MDKRAKLVIALSAAIGWAGLFGVGHFLSRRWARGFLWMVIGLAVYDSFWAVFRGDLLKLPLPILIVWGLVAFGFWLLAGPGL